MRTRATLIHTCIDIHTPLHEPKIRLACVHTTPPNETWFRSYKREAPRTQRYKKKNTHARSCNVPCIAGFDTWCVWVHVLCTHPQRWLDRRTQTPSMVLGESCLCMCCIRVKIRVYVIKTAAYKHACARGSRNIYIHTASNPDKRITAMHIEVTYTDAYKNNACIDDWKHMCTYT
jgi:hypothetical protein